MMKQREESITNAHISSKRLKDNACDLVDRISALPDSILAVILSFLPTKNAVATSILSNRWKFVWTTVHNLDFCGEFEEEDGSEAMKSEDGCSEENMKFVRFVNHVMLLHDAGFLNKFRLVWNDCILSHAYSWISTAVTKNVLEIFISAGVSEPFRLPLSVFKCDSLRSLELHGHCIPVSLCDEIVFCLPRLESLKLVSVYFECEKAFEELINGCPVLSYLHLCIDFIDGFDFTYIISSTSLRRLELYFEHKTSLKLEASSLEYFKLEGFIFTVFVQKSLTSLIEAEFNIELCEQQLFNADICNSLVEAVRAFDCAKALTLSADVIWYSNCLGTSDTHGHSNWTTPIAIPRCLSNNLKKVVLDGYYGYDDEREMIRYILMHGSALEAMKISLDSRREGEKFELLQEVCDFSRKSPTCKVKFFG